MSELSRYALLGAVALTAAFLAAAYTANPAAAQDIPHPANDGYPQKSWDTDNLLYTSGESRYSARTFGIPFHEYGRESEAGSVVATEERDRGCADFAEQQDRLVSSMNSNAAGISTARVF